MSTSNKSFAAKVNPANAFPLPGSAATRGSTNAELDADAADNAAIFGCILLDDELRPKTAK